MVDGIASVLKTAPALGSHHKMDKKVHTVQWNAVIYDF